MAALARLGRRCPSHPVETQTIAPPSDRVASRVIGVTGATGAPGRTFMSVNVAVALAAQGASVVLVDADPHLGAVAVQLDLAEDRSLGFLSHEATLRPVNEELVNRHLQRAAGIEVLAGRAAPRAGEGGPETIVSDVIELLRLRYQVVVVDVGALDCRPAQLSALACQLLVWVVVPTKLGTDLLDRTLAGPLAGQVRTRPSAAVLNRLGPAGLRDADRALRRRYGMAVLAGLPENRRACLEAEDRGLPAALGGPLAGSLVRCARAISAAVPGPEPSRAGTASPALVEDEVLPGHRR